MSSAPIWSTTSARLVGPAAAASSVDIGRATPSLDSTNDEAVVAAGTDVVVAAADLTTDSSLDGAFLDFLFCSPPLVLVGAGTVVVVVDGGATSAVGALSPFLSLSPLAATVSPGLRASRTAETAIGRTAVRLGASCDVHDQFNPDGPRPDQVAPDQVAPDQVAPDQVAPDQVAPDQVAPDQVAPDQVAPDQRPPDQVAPDQVAPDQVAPDQMTARPGRSVPCPARPGRAESDHGLVRLLVPIRLRMPLLAGLRGVLGVLDGVLGVDLAVSFDLTCLRQLDRVPPRAGT